MAQITLANGVLDQAAAAGGPVEVVDASGRVLGVFYPAADHDRLQSRIATLKHGFDEWCHATFPSAELERAAAEPLIAGTPEELWREAGGR